MYTTHGRLSASWFLLRCPASPARKSSSKGCIFELIFMISQVEISALLKLSAVTSCNETRRLFYLTSRFSFSGVSSASALQYFLGDKIFPVKFLFFDSYKGMLSFSIRLISSLLMFKFHKFACEQIISACGQYIFIGVWYFCLEFICFRIVGDLKLMNLLVC